MIRTGQYVDVGGGVRLHYASCGADDRPLLLLLHGFPEYWGAWEDVLPLLGDAYHAVAPDLRGFNLSSQPSQVGDYRMRAIITDLQRMVAALGYEHASVVGHDWGGAAAWQWAIAAPHSVERLVVLNSPHPVPFARDLASRAEQQAASAYMNWLRAPGSEAALAANDFRLLEGFFSGMQRSDAPWYTPQRARRYRAVWRRGLSGGTNLYRASPLYPPTAEAAGAAALTLLPEDFRVRVPTLVIWGEQDTALLPHLLQGLPELVDDLTIQRLPRATHWLAHEEPQTVAHLIRAFIPS